MNKMNKMKTCVISVVLVMVMSFGIAACAFASENNGEITMEDIFRANEAEALLKKYDSVLLEAYEKHAGNTSLYLTDDLSCEWGDKEAIVSLWFSLS